MKNNTHKILPYIFLFFSIPLRAQDPLIQNITLSKESGVEENNQNNPCISVEQYKLIEHRSNENAQKLGLEITSERKALTTSLNWPLKSKDGLSDCSYYGISAYVDQNPAAGVFTDYNCGTNTYDAHRGTDIAIYPYPFFKLDHDEVEVISAAAGTIIDKVDGNFDKNCGANNLQANYLVIQHADGSRVLYFHMKKHSLTSKSIGQTVIQGEFLGVVGSSGNSSGPHLHFEVWAGSTVSTLVDPYEGSCNMLNTQTWWAVQKPYTEPAIIKVSVNTTDAVFPACPTTETPNEARCFNIPFKGSGLPDDYAKFYIFMRNETQGKTAEMKILNPDGTVFNNWTYTSSTSYKFSARNFSKKLPSVHGTYKFIATYNGTSCEQTFEVVKAEITANGPLKFCEGTNRVLTASPAKKYAWNNSISIGDTTQSITVYKSGTYYVTITSFEGCVDISPPITVEVVPNPIAVITPDGPINFCEGFMVTLASNNAAGYSWSNGANTKNIIVTQSGNYVLTVTDQNGCSDTSAIKISVFTPQNGVPISVIGDSLFSPYYMPVYWYLNNNPIPVDTGINIKCKDSGLYYSAGYDSNGCFSISDTITLKCKTTASTSEVDKVKFMVWPNPTNENPKLVVNGIKPGIYSLEIFDMYGRILLHEVLSAGENQIEKEIPVSSFPSGLYLLTLQSNTNLFLTKFIKN